MRKKEIYFVTRPRLASYLFELGFIGKPVPNPWDTSRTAWQFPIEAKHAGAEYLQTNVTAKGGDAV